MSIRVSGLISGLDTDSIVQELVSAYNVKKNKYVKEQTSLKWKMDAWKDLNKKVISFYKSLDNIRFSGGYNTKKTTCSDPTKATVTGSGKAINGTQSLEVNEVAQTGYLTGAKLGNDVKGTTTLSELDPSFTGGSIAVTVGGNTKNIELTGDMTLDSVASALSSAGVSASFDSANHRMYISAKESGVENDFALTATDAGGTEALKKMGIYTRSDADNSVYQEWVDFGTIVEPDGSTREATAADYVDILNTIAAFQGDATNPDSIAYLQAENARLGTENSALQEEYNYGSAYNKMKSLLQNGSVDGSGVTHPNLSADEQAELEGLLKKTEYTEDERTRLDALKTQLGLNNQNWEGLTSAVNTVKAYEGTDDASCVDPAIRDEVHAAYANGTLAGSGPGTWLGGKQDVMTANANAFTANAELIADKQEYIDSYSLVMNAVPAASGMTVEERAQKIIDKIAFARQQVANTGGTSDADPTDGNAAKRVKGTDAEIVLNGATYTSSSNSITINGITITAQQKTNGQPVTVTTETDTQGIYDSLKKFVKDYNDLIKEMDTMFNAASSKGYAPLTTEEKDAMTDKEVEEWEKKIKDSVLRRDDTLDSVMNLFTTSMMKGFTLSDGKTYSLSSFGINTQEYFLAAENETSCLHIDGDSEDELTKGKTNRLMSSLQDNPEMVEEFFKALSDNLYKEVNKRVQSGSTLHSRDVIYHDKVMQKEYDDYSKTIKKWEQKVKDMEESYYRKFAAMETALSKLQSSTNALSGLLGS